MGSPDDLPALLAMIDELRADGLPEADIEEYLRDLDRAALDRAITEMREAGYTDDEIGRYWREVGSFGDTEPDDMIDADDDPEELD